MVWIVLPKARIPSEVISWKVIFFDETIQVHAAICLGIAVGRQGMIRAGSIIACAFRSIWTHKDTAGVLDSLRDSGVIRRLDNQVFGSVLVREVYDFLRIFQYDDTAVR